nr:MAG TPA: hypothetical protein [Caudoviricetes sp.]
MSGENLVLNSGVTFYNNVDGSTFNGFEYFYTLWELDKSTKWGFLSSSSYIEFIKDFLTKKYNFNSNCLKNIIVIDPKKLQKYHNVLIIDYYALTKLDYLPILADNYFCISGSKFKSKRLVNYFIEYPHICPDGLEINYKSKFRFDLFKEIKQHKQRIFVNYCNQNLNINTKYMQRKDILSPLFYDEFNKIIYIQNPDKIDIKPRIFHEAKFFNIKYRFISKGIKDGAYYRYNDSKTESLESRLLTSSDSLITSLNI